MPKIIYCITNTITDDIYVGQTTQSISARFAQHKRLSKYGNSHLHRAIRKYGIPNFKYHVLEELDELTCINTRECFWIASLKPQYNMTLGGGGSSGYNMAESQKQAISKKMLGNIPWNKGLKDCYSPEVRANLSAKLVGRRAWNKGIPNPTAADNGKRGAEKMKNIAIGRKRKYLENGKWTWEYPNK